MSYLAFVFTVRLSSTLSLDSTEQSCPELTAKGIVEPFAGTFV